MYTLFAKKAVDTFVSIIKQLHLKTSKSNHDAFSQKYHSSPYEQVCRKEYESPSVDTSFSIIKQLHLKTSKSNHDAFSQKYHSSPYEQVCRKEYESPYCVQSNHC